MCFLSEVSLIMVFYLIGIGLGDPQDITVKGLNVVKTASQVYLEAYTSILSCGRDELVSHNTFLKTS